MESEVVFNIVRLLKRGVTPYELMHDFDYQKSDVLVSLRIISYVEKCQEKKQGVIPE